MPGYVFTRQVPPTSSAASSRLKSWIPFWRRRIAVAIPASPAPTISTSAFGPCARIRGGTVAGSGHRVRVVAHGGAWDSAESVGLRRGDSRADVTESRDQEH